MIAVVWQFDVKPGRHAQFEEFYGAEGEWTKMSRRTASFIGSSFLRELTQEPRYLLVEYWSEMLPYERHLADLEDEIAALEQTREQMVQQTTPLGVFHALDVPDRFGQTWSRRDGRSMRPPAKPVMRTRWPGGTAAMGWPRLSSVMVFLSLKNREKTPPHPSPLPPRGRGGKSQERV